MKNEDKMQEVDRICWSVCVIALLVGAGIIAILLLAIILFAPFLI